MKKPRPPRPRRGTQGGPATFSGVEFQKHVGAWLAAHWLADEQPADWIDTRDDSQVVRIAMEANSPVDDIVVTTSASSGLRTALLQCKITVRLDKSVASPLGEFVGQAVAQVRSADRLPSVRRSFSAAKDCVVLVPGPGSASSITKDLRAALAMFRANRFRLSVARSKVSLAGRAALDLLVQHIRREWRAATGRRPTTAQVEDVLRALRIGSPDVDGAPAVLARAVGGDRLRRSRAWTALKEVCDEAARLRGEHELATLRTALQDRGVELLPLADVAQDIARLNDVTREQLAWVYALSVIRFGPTTIHVNRPCVSRLIELAGVDPLIVVGEPGAGKSGVLHDAVVELRQRGSDVVFMTTERLGRAGTVDPATALGLAHDLTAVLSGWTGVSPAFLVIDAIDALRSSDGVSALLGVLAHLAKVAPRWRPLVSIRRFDLRWSSRLQGLFHGAPPDRAHADPVEFANVSHFLVPAFGAAEAIQIAEQSAGLAQAANALAGEMGDAIWLPFNLRLLAGVLETLPPGAHVASGSASQLLDLYWERCVAKPKREEGGPSPPRVRALGDVVRAMIQQKRLILDEHEVESISRRQIDALVSDGVLAQGGSTAARSVRFAHHFLFDYVAARVALQVERPAVRQLASSDVEVALAFRPSLLLSFDRLWSADTGRHAFWDTALAWMEEVSRPLTQFVPATSAARCYRRVADAEYLIRLLSDPTEPPRKTDALLRLFISAVVHQGRGALVGSGVVADWCGLARSLSESAVARSAWSLRYLLVQFVEKAPPMTAAQFQDAGVAARNLLAHVLVHVDQLVEDALLCVARTTASDPAATAAALAPVLRRSDVETRGFRTLRSLAFNIEAVIAAAPDLAAAIYEAAFTYEETSRDVTAFSKSQILGMTSNRKQDFDGARYSLAKAFGELAAASMDTATRVVVRAIDASRPGAGREEPDVEFDVDGRAMRLRQDGSAHRFISSHPDRSDPEGLLGTWRRELEGLAARADRDQRFEAALDSLATSRVPALVWAELIEAAAKEPAWLGQRVRQLAWNTKLLAQPDLTHALGALIAAVHGGLAPGEAEQIENAILALPEFDRDPGDVEERWRIELRRSSRRAVLLGCVGQGARSAAAQGALADLQRLGGPAALEERRGFEGGWAEPRQPERDAEDASPVGAELRRIRAEVSARHAGWHQGRATLAAEDLDAVERELVALDDALEAADDAAEATRRAAFLTLVDGCAHMAHTPLVESSSRLRDLVVRVMLQACEDLEPEGGQEEEMRYTQSPSWSRPVPRADAAQALPLLLRRVTSSSSRREILDAMRRVAADASPIVRHHFSLTLRYAGRRDEDHVLEIVEGMLTTEQQAPVVIDCLVCLARQVVNDEDARIDLVLLAWDRAPTLLGRDGADDVRENCAKICLERYLRKDDAVGRDLLATIASDPVTYHAEVGALAGALRDELAVDQDEPDGGAPPPPERRARAVKFFTRLCSEFQAACKSWLATPIAERDQSKAEHLVRGVDHLAHEILFASEQSDEAKRSATSPKFLYDLTPAIEHVADVGIVPASFTLLKTLRFFRAIAPAATLRLASRAVVSARASGLGVESLAADEAVKLIEELLAENRDIFRGRGAPARRARNEVADLLDVFVEYGWPRAMTLASRLHEVFS